MSLDCALSRLSDDAAGYPALLSTTEHNCLTVLTAALQREAATADYLLSSYRDDSLTTALKAERDPSYVRRGWLFWKDLERAGGIQGPEDKPRIVAHWLIRYGVKPSDMGIDCVARDLYVAAVAAGVHSAALDLDIPLVVERCAPSLPVSVYEGAA